VITGNFGVSARVSRGPSLFLPKAQIMQGEGKKRERDAQNQSWPVNGHGLAATLRIEKLDTQEKEGKGG